MGLFYQRPLVAAAEELEQLEEEVDEVEVEGERPDDRQGLDRAVAAVRVDLAELLGVVGGEAAEDDHAAAGGDELERAALHEDVHHHGDDHPEEAEVEEARPGAE